MTATLQEIHHRGVLAAVVVGDQAMIRPHVTDHDLPDVEAMCLYAIEIHTGTHPGPYTDHAAERYAQTAQLLTPRS